MTIKQLKKGFTYTKNNYTIYYSCGFLYFSSMYDHAKARTFKELKQVVKEWYNLNISIS